MDWSSLWSWGSSRKRSSGSPRKVTKASGQVRKPALEPLEDRFVLSGNTISGHVYHDMNVNGRFDEGDTPIAQSTLELRNEADQVIATATTGDNGYYEFDHDPSKDTSLTSVEHTLTIPRTPVDFTEARFVEQFNPNLGELVRVEIIHEGAITSELRVENMGMFPARRLHGLVTGTMTLTGPEFQIESEVRKDINQALDLSAYDGEVDFAGSSGEQFAAETVVTHPNLVMLHGEQVAAYIGRGHVQLLEDVVINSETNSNNMIVGITNEAEATITVRYSYLPHDHLEPGLYSVVQRGQPLPEQPGMEFPDGAEYQNGLQVPNSVGSDRISIFLNRLSARNNDFTELPPVEVLPPVEELPPPEPERPVNMAIALSSSPNLFQGVHAHGGSVTGHVFDDVNGDGQKDVNEAGLGDVAVRMNGLTSDGVMTYHETTTNADGTFTFDELSRGAYIVKHPALPDETTNTSPFAGTLSGFVYSDDNNNGIKDADEQGIAGIPLHLLQKDSDALFPVDEVRTNAEGFYQFVNVAAGEYTILQGAQAIGYQNGLDQVGSQGGVTGDDRFDNIVLTVGQHGNNNNFGEVPAHTSQSGSSLSGFVYVDANVNGVRDVGEAGIAAIPIHLRDVATGTLRTVHTDAQGFYLFDAVEPGEYTILQGAQPIGYANGEDAVGSQGGLTGDDRLDNILIGKAIAGYNNNFGEWLL